MRFAGGARRVGVSGAVLLVSVALALSACTAGQDPESSNPSANSIVAEAKPGDDSVTATCAAFSIIFTTIGNAQRDLASGAISTDQHAALMDSAYVGFQSLLTFPGDQRGLRPETEAVVNYIEANPATTPALLLDPSTKEYQAAIEPLTAACLANGSEIATYGTTGG